MAEEIDYKIIERQLAILMTNSVAFASKLYDLFVSSTPMDIEFNVWTSVDEFETITVPNRAKGNIPASYGPGSPEGEVESSYGSIYLDETDGSIYIKTTLDGADGWLKLITETDMSSHDRSINAHDGVLAKIDGAYANGVPNTFIVDDIIEGVPHSGDDLDESYFAVNRGSLFKLLGGLENLRTENKDNIVSAINEVASASNYDSACVISGIKNSFSNASAFMSLTKNENDKYSLTLTAPFILTSVDGTKYTFNQDITKSLEEIGLPLGKICSVYMDLDPDIMDNVGRLVILKGLFHKQSTRPHRLAEGDGWLDTSSFPYRFVAMEKDEFMNLVEVEKNYVFLGELEKDSEDE